ncbi:MAG TPA: ABC transporter permease [Candidatus Binatia bacterium]|nr:ABC transporter permease [Candidatus Binatia bacterium]
MSPRRVLAVTRRIVDLFRHDHRSLALVVVAPLVVTALLGWVVRGSESGTVRLLVVDADTGPAGAQLVAAIEGAAAGTSVEVVEGGSDPAVVDDRLADGDADVALVVPDDFSAALISGRGPTLRLVTAGVDPAGEGGAAGAVVELLGRSLRTLLPDGVGSRLPNLERSTIYLPIDADALDAIAPVFLGYFAYFFVFILTGISFLRERLGGTLERLLATPVTRAEIVTGYSLGFGIFATLQVVLLTAFVLLHWEIPALGPIPAFVVGLDVPSAGSPILAFVLALALAVGAVSLGIFLSTFARTEFQILQFIPIVIVPQGLLGGIFWPIDRLPDLLRPIAQLLPLTYAVEGLRAVMIRGAGLDDPVVLRDLAILVAIALLFVALAARTIRREIA